MAIDSMRCVRILVAISINDVIDFEIDSIQFNTIKNTCIYVYRTHVMGTHIGINCHRPRRGMRHHTNTCQYAMRCDAKSKQMKETAVGQALFVEQCVSSKLSGI